jgi:ankyrin repeat protein
LFDSPSDFSGRFRWVALQLNSLSTNHSMWALRKALETLPPGLEETYRRILEKVNGLERPSVRLILQWLCFSFRPLRIEELAQIWCIGDAIGPPFNHDAVVFHPEDILDISPGILSLTEVVTKGDDWSLFPFGTKLQIVQLAHFSVKEYLLSPSAACWALGQERAHVSILRSSMAYFMHHATIGRRHVEHPCNHPTSSNRWDGWRHEHSLVEYGAKYTRKHLSTLSQLEHPDLFESFKCLLNPSSGFLEDGLLFVYFGLPASSPAEIGPNIPGAAAGMSLLLGARLGLTRTVNWLLSVPDYNQGDEGHLDINFACCLGQGTPCGPALVEASAQGHIGLVKVLLSDTYRTRGLDVDRQHGKTSRNALHCAAYYGSEDIVQLLINAGANVNEPECQHGNALQTASRTGHANIVRMLLDHGADANAIARRARTTALQTATRWGQKEIVRLLIDAGADVNYGSVSSHDPLFAQQSALQIAVDEGRADLVSMLIDAKANILAGGISCTLCAAARKGREDILRMLLDAPGVVIPQQIGTFALLEALLNGHNSIAHILVSAGVDPGEAEKEYKRKCSKWMHKRALSQGKKKTRRRRGAGEQPIEGQ